MARRKLTKYLIDRDQIKEKIRLIEGSSVDYVSTNGNIYSDYGNNKFYPKNNFINKHNGYLYCGINYDNGTRQRRVHKLVAETFLPNPHNYPIVMHLDNNKSNPCLSNLKWGTIQENTQNAFDDKLIVNKKGWDDDQSIPVCCFDLNRNLIKVFGSISQAAKELKMTKPGIIYQCDHNLKTKPRSKFYFRYFNEYKEHGFVL